MERHALPDRCCPASGELIWRAAAWTTEAKDALSRLFSLKVSHTLSYLNEPVPGFGSTDTIISAALAAKFTR